MRTENRNSEQKQKLRTDKAFPFSVFRFCFCFCFLFSVFGCSRSNPAWEYMPDMADQPALKAQKYDPNLPHHRSLLTPVPGTIARDVQPYPYKGDPEGAGQNLKNPLPATREILLAGEKVFKTYCSVCHGSEGLGNGSVVPPFPPPPSLHSEKIRGWSDGRIYHVVTEGQGIMPAYASQIEPEKRWTAIHYVRALQRAHHPKPEDFEVYKKFRIQQRVKK